MKNYQEGFVIISLAVVAGLSLNFFFASKSYFVSEEKQQLAEPLQITVTNSCTNSEFDGLNIREFEQKTFFGITFYERSRELFLDKSC